MEFRLKVLVDGAKESEDEAAIEGEFVNVESILSTCQIETIFIHTLVIS